MLELSPGSLGLAQIEELYRSPGPFRIDQPAMEALLADLAIESEAATALGFRLAQAFDDSDPLARLLTPIAKYWVCKRAPGMVYEAMEAHGGAGYVETGPMPRLFRQSPLNAIWEGSGNVIALDVLRAINREQEASSDSELPRTM